MQQRDAGAIFLSVIFVLFSGPQTHAAGDSSRRTVSGRIEIEYRDSFKNDNLQHNFYFVRDKKTGKRTEIRPKRGRTPLRDGMEVTATGTDSGNGVLQQATLLYSTESGTSTNPPVLASISPDNLGEVRTAVILVNWDTDPTWKPWTVDQIKQQFFGTTGKTVSNYYKEVSYGQSWLNGDVLGWYTVPYSGWQTTVRQMIAAQGVDLSTYKRTVFIRAKDSSFYAGVAGPGYAEMNGTNSFEVIVHELGHTFGLAHSHSIYCGKIASGLCRYIEYGDRLDVMGDGGNETNASHFNAGQKENIGFLPPATQVQQSGIYQIEPLETAPAGKPKSLKIAKDKDPSTGNTIWYYLEYRSQVGFNDFQSNLTPGVLFHLTNFDHYGYGWSDTHLISMKPKVLAENPTYGGSEMSDPALAVGKSFYDADAGILFETISADATGASVKITFGVKPPVLNLTSPTASSQAVVAGSTAFLSAEASSSGSSIAAVDFKINGSVVCHVTTSPYNCNWLVPSTSNLIYNLEVVATDVRGVASETLKRILGTDLVAPQISMTYPGMTNVSTVTPGSYATVYWTGSDNVGIVKEELFINGVAVIQNTYSAPVVFRYGQSGWWIPAYYANATYVATMRITDASGNSSSGSVTMTAGAGGQAPLVLPTVSISAPVDSGTLIPYVYTQLEVAGASSVGASISSTTCYSEGLFVDDCRIGAFGWVSFIVIGPVGKSFTIGAKAIDQYKVVSTMSTVNVKIVAPPPVADTTAPVVSITSPLGGSAVAANSVTAIAISASDNVGVKSVEVRVNGSLICTLAQSPFTCNWSVPKGGGKTYTIEAKAFDAAGNSAVRSSTVYTLKGSGGGRR